jgi:hypothetical protein
LKVFCGDILFADPEFVLSLRDSLREKFSSSKIAETFPPMKKIFAPLALFAAGLLVLPSVLAQTWNFDAGSQGWTVYDTIGSGNYSNIGTGLVNWTATGGNPGGFISAVDASNGSFMFQAPISGVNYSAFNGGLLNFSLQTNQTPDFVDDSVIVFKGGVGNLTIVSALGSLPGVSSWTNYSLGLNASAFHIDNLSGATVTSAQFADVLGNLNLFLVDGEFHNGVSETTSLDSVAFVAPNVVGAVPEPSVYGLVGAALLIGVIKLRRRNRR